MEVPPAGLARFSAQIRQHGRKANAPHVRELILRIGHQAAEVGVWQGHAVARGDAVACAQEHDLARGPGPGERFSRHGRSRRSAAHGAWENGIGGSALNSQPLRRRKIRLVIKACLPTADPSERGPQHLRFSDRSAIGNDQAIFGRRYYANVVEMIVPITRAQRTPRLSRSSPCGRGEPFLRTTNFSGAVKRRSGTVFLSQGFPVALLQCQRRCRHRLRVGRQ